VVSNIPKVVENMFKIQTEMCSKISLVLAVLIVNLLLVAVDMFSCAQSAADMFQVPTYSTL